MAFREILFPTTISYSSSAGPGFLTNIIGLEEGNEQRIPRRSAAKHTYSANYGIKSLADLMTVKKFYMNVLGCTYGFRFRDPFDNTSRSDGTSTPTFDDQSIGAGNGSRTQFQLKKRYHTFPYAFVRNITKPVEGSVRVGANNIEVTSGFSVDHTTGVVTFDTPPLDEYQITAGFRFDTPCRFGKAVDEALSATYDDFSYGSVPDIPIVEILDPTPVIEDFIYGGSVEKCADSPVSVTISGGRVWIFDTTEGSTAILDNEGNLPLGGPIFFILNLGPEDLTVKRSDFSTLITVEPGAGIEILMSMDADSNRILYAI